MYCVILEGRKSLMRTEARELVAARSRGAETTTVQKMIASSLGRGTVAVKEPLRLGSREIYSPETAKYVYGGGGGECCRMRGLVWISLLANTLLLLSG